MTKRASEEYLQLIGYVSSHGAGDTLLYSVIEGELGISMDRKGREKLRRAIEHENLEALSIANHGYELMSPKTVRPVADHRMLKMERTSRRTVKALTRAAEQFIDALPKEEQRILLMESAMAGAIRLQLENERQQRARQKPLRVVANEQLPEINI